MHVETTLPFREGGRERDKSAICLPLPPFPFVYFTAPMGAVAFLSREERSRVLIEFLALCVLLPNILPHDVKRQGSHGDGVADMRSILARHIHMMSALEEEVGQTDKKSYKNGAPKDETYVMSTQTVRRGKKKHMKLGPIED